jgi:hypothetical protein
MIIFPSRIGAELAVMTDSCQWWIGDWLVHGRAKFGDDKYARAAALSGYAQVSLAQYAWVSESVPRSSRLESLSWSHHQEVAGLPPRDRDKILKKAEAENLTRADLRSLLHGEKNTERSFFPQRWIQAGIEKLKALAESGQRAQVKDAIRPLVELYNTL